MGRHSVERGKQARSSASKSWPAFGRFRKSDTSGDDSTDGTLFGDPSLNLFGCAEIFDKAS